MVQNVKDDVMNGQLCPGGILELIETRPAAWLHCNHFAIEYEITLAELVEGGEHPREALVKAAAFH